MGPNNLPFILWWNLFIGSGSLAQWSRIIGLSSESGMFNSSFDFTPKQSLCNSGFMIYWLQFSWDESRSSAICSWKSSILRGFSVSKHVISKDIFLSFRPVAYSQDIFLFENRSSLLLCCSIDQSVLRESESSEKEVSFLPHQIHWICLSQTWLCYKWKGFYPKYLVSFSECSCNTQGKESAKLPETNNFAEQLPMAEGMSTLPPDTSLPTSMNIFCLYWKGK